MMRVWVLVTLVDIMAMYALYPGDEVTRLMLRMWVVLWMWVVLGALVVSALAGVSGCAANSGSSAEHTAGPTVEETAPSTVEPTATPTSEPTEAPTPELTAAPTAESTEAPTPEPTAAPTAESTEAPTPEPTAAPTAESTEAPTPEPTAAPTAESTEAPTPEPTAAPTAESTEAPTPEPTAAPTAESTEAPTPEPTAAPIAESTEVPTPEPTAAPTAESSATLVPELATVPTPRPTTSPTPAPRSRIGDEGITIWPGSSEDCNSSIWDISDQPVVLGRLQWSPDGSEILFAGLRDRHGPPVDFVKTDGSRLGSIKNAPSLLAGDTLLMLTKRTTSVWEDAANVVSDYTGAMSTFDVSADGSRIAYSTCAYAEVDDDYEIVVSNIDGTDTKRLTDNSGSEFYPVWSPDGTRLAFVQRSGLTINTVATGESIDLPIHVAPRRR